ncbi:MAG TPA: ATP-binding cassette domain-containing protein [Acidimicrobiales bacterium]|nr:ATP-binding cassette domain-containing protein [Acidimicrobiales bacterium]
MRDGRRGALDLGVGETTVLLGASGQGKTAWIRSLLGFDAPFDQVRAFGRPLTPAAVPELLSWVPERDGVFLSETVWQNCTSKAHGLGRVDPELVVDALDLVGLADRAGEPVAHLGTGGRRRVALARALARRRPLLVVDGPLDPTLWVFWRSITERMSWLQGIVIAASVADEVARQAETVALVDQGAVIGQAPLAMLEGSLDPQVRSVLAWVTP